MRVGGLMIRFSRIVPYASCLAAICAVAGCRVGAPLPLPDTARSDNLSLSAAPGSLVIRPGSSGRVRFAVVDELGAPVPDYPLAFAIVKDGSGDGTVDARLSSDVALTDGNGSAVIEIIVGNLASDNRPAAFAVKASSQGSAAAQADITVTTNAYSVEILPVPAIDLLGSATITTTRLLFYDDSTCGDLDLTNLNTAPTKPRTPRTVAANKAFLFSGVAASGVHAVVGLGLDSNTFVQIGGCIDVPGNSLFETETIRATLFMDRLFPAPQGTYLVKSDFKLVPPPSALGSIQSVWRQWGRCPFDPARLWLDCTIDALATDATSDPLDCVPVQGAEGPLGNLISAQRGKVTAALDGSAAGASDSPCRGQFDSNGNASLESVVDALFSGTRSQLTALKLGTFATELAVLLDDVRIGSQLTISGTGDVNTYDVRHDLLDVTFPDAIAPVSFKTLALGLPITSASGIQATMKAGQLFIPKHGFTLHLGTTARYGFEATSFGSRGATDALGLVNTVFRLAQSTDRGALLTGCDALDAAVCDQSKQPRGCLVDACRRGLDALATKLTHAFDNLDGAGLDFFLSGSAPVVDLDGDGRADALGLGGRAGTVSAGPGLWSAALDSRGAGYVVYGSWTASVTTKLP